MVIPLESTNDYPLIFASARAHKTMGVWQKAFSAGTQSREIFLRSFKSSNIRPVPSTTAESGSSLIETGRPVSSRSLLSRFFRSAPPPVSTMPRSMMSAESSGGVRSSATLTALTMIASVSSKASRISSSLTTSVLGTPSIRFRPLISMVIGLSRREAGPISILTGSDSRRHRLVHQEDFAGFGAQRGVLDGALFHLGYLGRDSDDDTRRHPHLPVVSLLNEVGQHLFRDLEVSDHAVLHRPDGGNVTRCSAEHFLGFPAHRLHLSGHLVDGDDRGLRDNDAFALDEHQRVGGAQVDGELVGESTKNRAQIHLSVSAV